MRVAQDKLVLGMAHDLRTPLTGLMTYIEILRKQENEGKVSREYIDKAFDKIFQIRALSDQMFEYFFVFSKEKIDLESAEEVESAFGDYMSELLALLDYVGFSVNAKKADPQTGFSEDKDKNPPVPFPQIPESVFPFPGIFSPSSVRKKPAALYTVPHLRPVWHGC